MLIGTQPSGTITGVARLKKKIEEANRLVLSRQRQFERKETEEKRKLTDDDINDIINDLPSVRSPSSEVSNNASQEIKDIIINELKIHDNLIYPSAIPELKKTIISAYKFSIMAAGQPVGILAAQAIAAQLMQATLNTFHKSGSAKNVSMGLKAYRQILSAAENMINRMCDIYFKDPVSFEEVIYDKRAELVEIKVTDLMTEPFEIKNVEEILNKSIEFNIDDYSLYDSFVGVDTHGIGLKQFILDTQYFVRLTMDLDLMYAHKITIDDVCQTIRDGNKEQIICIPSPIRYKYVTERRLVKEGKIQVIKDVKTRKYLYYLDIYVDKNSAKKSIEKLYGGSLDEDFSFGMVPIKSFNNGQTLVVGNLLAKNQENLQVQNILKKQVMFHIDDYKKYEESDANIRKNRSSDFLTKTNKLYRLTLDPTYFSTYQINIEDICQAIVNNFQGEGEIVCVPSPLFSQPLMVVRPEYDQYQNLVEKQYQINGYYLLDVYILKEYDIIPMVYYQATLNHAFQNMTIKGIEGIKQLYPEELSVWSIVENEIRRKDNLWLLKLHKSKIADTGITVDNLKALCLTVGMEIVDFSPSSREKYGNEYLLVRTPEKPVDADTVLKAEKKLVWKPGKVINYYKLKDLDDVEKYRKDMEEEKNRLIDEGREDEAKTLPMTRPRSSFDKALNFVYAFSEGSNLEDLHLREDIDYDKILSNDVREIIRNYGVEAARSHIVQNLYDNVVMNDNFVDPRHVMVIADYMTSKGFLTPITLKGLGYQDTSTLTKAGYKMPKDFFHSAAITGSKESLLPTYASIMTGRRMRMGTGLVKTRLNPTLEKDLLQDLRKTKGIDGNSLAEAVGRLEEGDQSFTDDNIIEQQFIQQDDMGNVLIKLEPPSFIPPEQSIYRSSDMESPSMISTTGLGPSIQMPLLGLSLPSSSPPPSSLSSPSSTQLQSSGLSQMVSQGTVSNLQPPMAPIQEESISIAINPTLTIPSVATEISELITSVPEIERT